MTDMNYGYSMNDKAEMGDISDVVGSLGLSCVHLDSFELPQINLG